MKNKTTEVASFNENRQEIFKIFRFSTKEMKVFEMRKIDGDYSSMTKMIKDIIVNKKYKTIGIDLEARKNTIELITEVRKISQQYKIIAGKMNAQNIESFTTDEKTVLIGLLFRFSTLYSKIEEQVNKL